MKKLLIIFTLALLPTALLLPQTIFAAESPDNAHSITTNYMLAKSQGVSGSSDDDIPIILSAVDGDTLVVGISAHVLSQNITYTEKQVQDFLGITTPLQIKYLVINTSSSPAPSNTTDTDYEPFNAEIACLEENVDPPYDEFCASYFEDLDYQRQYPTPSSSVSSGGASGAVFDSAQTQPPLTTLTPEDICHNEGHPAYNTFCLDHFENLREQQTQPPSTSSGGASGAVFGSAQTQPPLTTLTPEDICHNEGHPAYNTFCLDHFENLREQQEPQVSGDSENLEIQDRFTDTVCYTETIAPEYQDICANYFETMEEDARDVLSSTPSSHGQVSGTVDTTLDLLESDICFKEEIDPQYQDACRHYLEDYEDDSAEPQVSGQAPQSVTVPTTESFDDIMTLAADVCFEEIIDPAYQDLCIGFLEDLENERLSNPVSGQAVSGQSASNPCTISTSSSYCYYYNRYASQCLPPNTASRCSTYASIITSGGFQLPTSSSTSQPNNLNPAPVTVPSGTNIFYDSFSNGLGKWTVSGNSAWRTGIFDENYRNSPLYTSSDIVAEADYCYNDCVLTSQSINLRGQSWAYLEFGRFVDGDFDGNEGMKVELYNGNRWNTVYHWTATNNGDDDTWHVESFNLANYRVSNFKIKVTVESNSAAEDAALNNVRVIVQSIPNPPVPSHSNPSPVSIPSTGVNIFYAPFESGLSGWTLSGDGRWRTGVFDESYRNSPTYQHSDIVAESDDCDNTCIMTSSSINLRGKSWAYLEFGRYMDNDLDDSEGIKVELYDGASWNTVYHWTATAGQDDDTWHIESFRLNSNYLTSNFKIKITAASNSGTEDVGINNVRIVVPTLPSPTPPTSSINPRPVTIPSNGVNIFSDTFENGISQWTLSGQGRWTAKVFDESFRNSPTYTTTDKVANANDCDSTCIMTSPSINLQGKSWAYLQFGRFVDNSFDGSEGIKVELYDGARWNTVYHWTATAGQDDDTWHIESFRLNSNYLTSNFKIKVTATSSTSAESAGINNVRVVVPPTTAAPPSHTNPRPVTVPTGTDIFSDNFENGLSKWTLSGQGRWTAKIFDESSNNPPTYTTSDKVANANNCDNTCVMTTSSINLQGKSWAYLQFGRYLDNGLDTSEGIKVELYDGARWSTAYHWTATAGDHNDRWHVESIRLGSNYLVSNFKVRIIATTDSVSESAGINDVRVVVPTPPPPSHTNPRPVTVPTGTDIFSDNFENGLSKWTLSGQGRWTAKIFDESSNNPPTYTTSDKVANANNCDNTCVMTTSSINLQGKSWAYLQFGRYLDNGLDTSEGIKVELYDGARWSTAYHWTATAGDHNDRWHVESIRLGSNYLVSNFKVRIIATTDSVSESAGINDVRVVVPTPPPPSHTNPRPVTVPSDGINAFADDFENGISKWALSGAGRWTTSIHDESFRNPPLYPISDIVADASICNPECIMTSPSINLRGKSWAYLEFGRFVDNIFRGNDGLKVELYDGTRWSTAYHWTGTGGDGDDRWYVESMRLNNNYLTSIFKIRITASFDSSAKDVGINNIRVVVPDTISSTIAAPPDISITATSRAPITLDLGRPTIPSGSTYTITNNAPNAFMPGQSYTIIWFLESIYNTYEVIQRVFIGPPPPDTDGDGISDHVDLCPTSRGSLSTGCLLNVYGGSSYGYVYASNSNLRVTPSTVGISAVDSAGNRGIVVSGHGATNENFPFRMNVHTDNREMFPKKPPILSRISPHVINNGGVDAAFVRVTNSSIGLPLQVITEDGILLDVAYGNLNSVAYNETVNMYGISTNSNGRLLYKNATTALIGGIVHTNMGLATYTSIGGDSGAPVIHNANGRSFVVGINLGNGCIFHSPFEGLSPTDLCDVHNARPDNIGIFSAWENVAARLGVSSP